MKIQLCLLIVDLVKPRDNTWGETANAAVVNSLVKQKSSHILLPVWAWWPFTSLPRGTIAKITTSLLCLLWCSLGGKKKKLREMLETFCFQMLETFCFQHFNDQQPTSLDFWPTMILIYIHIRLYSCCIILCNNQIFCVFFPHFKLPLSTTLTY